MGLKLFLTIAIRIIILFTFPILVTFINWNKLLNDTYSIKEIDGPFSNNHWIWSTTHCWIFWCLFCLFILSLVDTFVFIRKMVLNEYPDLK